MSTFFNLVTIKSLLNFRLAHFNKNICGLVVKSCPSHLSEGKGPIIASKKEELNQSENIFLYAEKYTEIFIFLHTLTRTKTANSHRRGWN